MINQAKQMIWRRGQHTVFVRNTFGSQGFPPDTPVLVPPRLIQDAQAIGVEFCNEEDAQVSSLPTKDAEPVDPGSRSVLIKEAILVILARAEKDPAKYREQFTAGNKPKIAVIAKEAGLKKVGSNEIKAVYLEMATVKEAAYVEQQLEKAAKKTAKGALKKDVIDESGAEDC
jgi:hypothetical protein